MAFECSNSNDYGYDEEKNFDRCKARKMNQILFMEQKIERIHRNTDNAKSNSSTEEVIKKGTEIPTVQTCSKDNSIHPCPPGVCLVNVKFTLDSSQSFATSFSSSTTIGEIREKLADVLEVKVDAIKLNSGNNKLSDSVVLANLVTKPFSTVTIRQESRTGETIIVEEKVRENIPSIDVITVHFPTEFCTDNVVVEIENQCCQKEWLGGYRSKLTGVEYHNAFTQTRPRERQVQVYDGSQTPAVPVLFHRDTQTSFPPKEKAVTTRVSRSTQMSRLDCYVSCLSDKILTARPDWPKKGTVLKERSGIVNKVIIIQKAVRDWLRGRRIMKVITIYKQLLAEKKKYKLKMLTSQAISEQNILTSSVYPSSRDDFYLLYLMVNKWLRKEWSEIFSYHDEVSRKSCRVLQLQKEIKVLLAIEKHRIEVKQESLKKEEMRFLEWTARPETFTNSKGKVTSIDDIGTQRAREFKEIYSQLINENVTPRFRMDFLIYFKQLFITHYMNYEYAEDLVSLIDREIDLISLNTKKIHLKGLRMRIKQLYLHFVRQKEFNPKAAKYKISTWPKTVDALYQCSRCQKLLPASKFPVHSTMKAYSQCVSCTWLKNIGHHRQDSAPYTKLLRQVQQSEMQKCCYSSVPFLLQQFGMSHLTNVIWHGQSAISECRNLTRLRHVRWLSDVEWAPWNTILLTQQEAKCHISIPDVFRFYGKSFVQKIQYKHLLASQHFFDLRKMDHYLRTDGEWLTISDSGPYFHASHADESTAQNEEEEF